MLIKRTELLVTQGECDIKLNLSDNSTLPHGFMTRVKSDNITLSDYSALPHL